MTDKQNFEKDIDVLSKRLDRIDKMEIDLANYEQMERDIEKIIEPYQLDWELDCLSLPSAIQSILERKEQECDRLENENKRLVGELANPIFDSFEELDKLSQTLTEIKEIVFPKNQLIITDSPIILKIQDKISECEGNDGN